MMTKPPTSGTAKVPTLTATRTKKREICAAAGLLLFPSLAGAAGLTWNTPSVLAKRDTSFITSPSVAAFNVGGGNTTYGGETWTADSTATEGVTVGGITLAYSGTTWSGAGPHFYTSDTPLLQDARYKDYGGGYGVIPTVSLTGLDSTKTYLVQYLLADNRADTQYTTTVKGTGDFAGINSAAEDYMFTDNRFTVFSATVSGSTSLTVQVGQLWDPDNSLDATKSQINAVRVVLVPEPSTVLVGSLGMLLLLRRRR